MQSHGCRHDGLANSCVHELYCVRCPCQMMGGLHVRIALFLFGCCASVGDLCSDFRFLYELKGFKEPWMYLVWDGVHPIHNVFYGRGRELFFLYLLFCPIMAV